MAQIAGILAPPICPDIAPALGGTADVTTTAGTYADLFAVLGAKLILDLDPDVGITYAIGAKASAWADQSARGNSVIQGSAANQPSITLNQLNGHASMRFTSTHYLTCTDLFTGLAVSDKPTFYVLQDVWHTNASYNAVTFRLSAASNDLVMPGFSHTTTSWNFYSNTSTIVSYVDGVTANVKTLYTLRSDATNSYIDRNNVQVASAVGGGISTAPNDLRVGAAFGGGFAFPGAIYRFLIVNPAPTAGEHTAIIDLLRARYPAVGIV